MDLRRELEKRTRGSRALRQFLLNNDLSMSFAFAARIYIQSQQALEELNTNETLVLIPYPRANEPVAIPPCRTGGLFDSALINGRNNFRISYGWIFLYFEGDTTNEPFHLSFWVSVNVATVSVLTTSHIHDYFIYFYMFVVYIYIY